MEQQMETGWSGTAGVNLALPVVKRMSIVQGATVLWLWRRGRPSPDLSLPG